MDAPIDIIISIVKRHLRETEAIDAESERNSDYKLGKIKACEELLEEFEGLKRLFN